MEKLEIMKKTILALMAALTVFAFAGCKTSKASSSETQAKYKYVGVWKIESLTGFDKEIPEAEMTIWFTEDSDSELDVTGFSGVNRFFTTIKAEGPNQFPIGNNMGSTKMMGSEEDMAFEDAFLELLCTAEDWTSGEGRLTVSNGKSKAVFYKVYGDK